MFNPAGACLCAAVALGCNGAPVWAADDRPDPQRKTATITRTDTPPRIDGTLDDAAWQAATVVDDDLRQVQPIEHAQPTERTEFRLLYDDRYLYLGARFWDSDPKRIVRHQLIQDTIVFNDDHIQLYLDPRDTRRGGYVFQVNSNGVQRDGLVLGNFEGRGFNMNWDGIWQAKSALDESGWSTELAIPFSTLDFDPRQPDWGMNMLRWVGRKRELIGWTYRDRGPTIDSYGLVRGFDGLSQGLGLDVVPSVVLADERDFLSGRTDTRLEPSINVFYRITPSLTGALTINTDFSATEVDDRQVNLTRFSLFFPEKRDFFLQNADIFEFGRLSANGRPFFSRTIGLSPSGEPVDLIGGVKLAGRVGRWNLGALAVRQDGFAGVQEDTLFVARVSANVLDQSTIGAIVTSGDPASEMDNSVVGVDFAYKNTSLIKGQSLEADGWYQVSDSEGVKGDDAAYGFKVTLPNDRINAQLRYQEIQQNFNPAMGFANRTGIKIYDGHIRWRWRFDNRKLRFYQARLSSFYSTTSQGALETRAIKLIPLSIENQPGDSLSVEFVKRHEVLFQPFDILPGITIPTGQYDYLRRRLVFATATNRPFAFNLLLENGGFYDGDRIDAVAGIAWKPSRHFIMDLDYTRNRVKLTDGNFTTKIVSLKTSVAFNVEWAWINTMQYDNVSDRLGINSRLRYIPRQGQEAFFVINYDFLVDSEDWRFDSAFRGFTLKFSYNFRF